MADDAPRVFFDRTTLVRRARKPHRCWFCREMIEVGAPYNQWVIMTEDDDRPHTYAEHVNCQQEYDGL